MKSNVIQMLLSIALAASLIFIPNLAEDLEATNSEIGIIGAVYGFAVFTSSYLFGRAADIYDRKSIIRLGLLFSTITFFLQALADPYFIAPLLSSPLLLALARGLVGFSLGMAPPALIAHVYESKRSLGRFTGFGALGWSIGTLTAGLIAFYWGVFIFSSACLLLAFLLSMTLPEVRKVKLKVPFFPKDLLKKNWNVYLPFFLRHLGANCIWIVYPLYIVSLGGDKFWIGVVYTVNTATQFVVMQFIDRFKGKTLVSIGLALSSITFFAISLAQSFLHLIPVQIMLAGSWSCLFVGSLIYLMKHNIEKSTAGGILGSLMSLAIVFGALVGGTLSELLGFRTTMYFAVGITLVGFFLFRLSNRKTVEYAWEPFMNRQDL